MESELLSNPSFLVKLSQPVSLAISPLAIDIKEQSRGPFVLKNVESCNSVEFSAFASEKGSGKEFTMDFVIVVLSWISSLVKADERVYFDLELSSATL